jgi:hypothetical protein
MSFAIALILKPFAFAAVAWLILVPARKAVEGMKDSRLKRLLLRRVQ